MSITIKPIAADELYEVNGKELYKDSNGNWIARIELTNQECIAFNNYMKAIQEGQVATCSNNASS